MKQQLINRTICTIVIFSLMMNISGCARTKKNFHGKSIGYVKKLDNQKTECALKYFIENRRLYFNTYMKTRSSIIPMHKYRQSIVTQNYDILDDVNELIGGPIFMFFYLTGPLLLYGKTAHTSDFEIIKGNRNYYEDKRKYKYFSGDFTEEFELLGFLDCFVAFLPGYNYWYVTQYGLSRKDPDHVEMTTEYFYEPVSYPTTMYATTFAVNTDSRYTATIQGRQVPVLKDRHTGFNYINLRDVQISGHSGYCEVQITYTHHKKNTGLCT